MTMLPSFQSNDPVSKISSRLAGVQEKIKTHAESCNRDPRQIVLIASGRALMADPVTHAAQAGVKHIVEEFLPEGIAKRPVVDHKMKNLTWHYMGSLPNKKVSLAVEFFDWIHSIDKITLAGAVKEAVKEKNKNINLLLEINPIGAKKRTGLPPEQIEELLNALVHPNVFVEGLSFKTEHFMTEADVLAGFQAMQKLHEKHKLKTLAMGSSRDYLQAITYGSTMLRLGSAVFGEEAYHMMGGNELENVDL